MNPLISYRNTRQDWDPPEYTYKYDIISSQIIQLYETDWNLFMYSGGSKSWAINFDIIPVDRNLYIKYYGKHNISFRRIPIYPYNSLCIQ